MTPLSLFESWLIRNGATMLSRGGKHASLVVLMFHRVLAKRDPLLPGEPNRPLFAELLEIVSEHFNILRLSEAVQRLQQCSLPPRAVCITFDDGYANNVDVALPLLAARRIPATVFVAPGYLNGARMFNDTIIEAVRAAGQELNLQAEGLGTFRFPDVASRIAAIEQIITALKYLPHSERLHRAADIASRVNRPLPTNLMMTDAQVKHLHESGVEIGAHTLTHPILSRVDAATARREIIEGKAQLEAIIGAPVTSFAYPNGKPGLDYDRSHVAIVREARFALAVSTAWGAMTTSTDALQIPRVAPWDRAGFPYAGRIAVAFAQRTCELA